MGRRLSIRSSAFLEPSVYIVFRSLFFQICTVYFVLLLGVLITVFPFTTGKFEGGLQQLFQFLYFEVAEEIAKDLRPHLLTFNRAELSVAFTKYEERDPRISLFLLDAKGNILVTSPRNTARSSNALLPGVSAFDLSPIKRFLAQTEILSDPIFVRTIPAAPSDRVFSAAVTRYRDKTGFLVAVLDVDPPAPWLARDIQSTRTQLLLFCLFSSSSIGWMMFYYITRRISMMGQYLQLFAEGDFTPRLVTLRNDELTRYAETFNFMADKTVAAIESLHLIEKNRRELFANISHDVRRPMASILNSLEALCDNSLMLSSEQEQELLTRASKRTQELDKLIAAVSELSMLDQPAYNIKQGSISLGEEVSDIIASFRNLASNREISLEYSGAEAEVHVEGDNSLLRRAVANLIENALLYTGKGGRVHVALSLYNGHALLDIADTGIGIAAHELKQLFVPFARGSQARNQNKHGTGLGLSIAKQIVELHQGTLTVTSTPGQGTTFRIEVPLR